MSNQQTQNLAERIAALLQENEKGSDDFSFVRASLEKINERLDKIEVELSHQNPKSQIPNLKSNHPSYERFLNLEEVSGEIVNSLQNEKACTFEPNGKPCDHCAMCSSRGF
jgi:predicted nuclease with TOPRIM domain